MLVRPMSEAAGASSSDAEEQSSLSEMLGSSRGGPALHDLSEQVDWDAVDQRRRSHEDEAFIFEDASDDERAIVGSSDDDVSFQEGKDNLYYDDCNLTKICRAIKCMGRGKCVR